VNRMTPKYRRIVRKNIRLSKKPRHDIQDSRNLISAWHEAGHALIALMNVPSCINWVTICPYKRVIRETDMNGFVNLEVAGEENYSYYMPPEYLLAGSVAESILTGQDFWECWWNGGLGDSERFEELHPEIDLNSKEGEELIDRTYKILERHKDELRAIAKRLLREREIPGWRGQWLNRLGETLPRMDTADDVQRRVREGNERFYGADVARQIDEARALAGAA